jgi:glycosyltransferase involved in cell wall biosynthesis
MCWKKREFSKVRAGGSAMVRSDCFVSVVAPLFNDEDIVESFVDDVIRVLRAEYANYELILVDDGSTDRTVERVGVKLSQNECMRLIRLSRHFGKEQAIAAGLDSAIGDFVVVMSPDSDPPELIPEMVARCRKSGCGVVSAVREDRKDQPLHLRWGAKLLWWYLNKVAELDVPSNCSDFHAFSRQSVNAVTRIRDRFRYLRTFSAWVGFGRDVVPYRPMSRRGKPRHKSLREAVNLAINLVVASTTYPLRFVAVASGFVGFAVLVALIVTVAPGWTSGEEGAVAKVLDLVQGLATVVILWVLALVSEYVARLLVQSQDRPLYLVLEERNSSVMIADEARKNVVKELG